MKTIALKGELRSGLGKASSKAVRKEGKTPCVLYGGSENVSFSVYEADFKNLVYTPNTYLVRLDINGKQTIAKLQDLQFHPVSESILHADFYELNLENPVELSIPVHVVGNSPGVRAGGKLMVKIHKLKVKGLIQDMPDFVEVNIDKLNIGKSIRVRDLNIPNVELLDTPENSVVSVIVTRASRSASAAGGMDDSEDSE
ncbi:MAG: 50S ribosomal protein L25/general stress protein Ctc [Flavobacteriales bacterium]|nr:50S ribosomal protein L25/general stress protein Ctc [Flavobacteriales bacterium]